MDKAILLKMGCYYCVVGKSHNFFCVQNVSGVWNHLNLPQPPKGTLSANVSRI